MKKTTKSSLRRQGSSKCLFLITLATLSSLAFGADDNETIAPPVTATNEAYEEISNFLTLSNLKKQLDDTGSITVRNLSGEVIQTYSREDLEKGKPECFDPAEPWNVGCVAIQRSYNPKYSPFALDYEAKIALALAKEAGQTFTPDEEVKFINDKKAELATQTDTQADEATGVGVLDLTAHVDKNLRAGDDLDIIRIFRRFDNYANMVPKFFKDCMQLTLAHFEERNLEAGELFNKKTYYQTSRIMMGVYPVHQTLVYNVTRHPETGAVTAAWKVDRRFNDPLGFKQFKFTEKIRNPNNPREKIDVPVFDMQKKEFVPSWLEKSMIFFPSTEYFEQWKAKLIADEARLNAWASGAVLINNNQMGAQNIQEQSGFFKIEPYAPHKYFVTKHLFLRVDPTNEDFDFRNRGENFERMRTGMQIDFINREASALRQALEELRKE